VISETNNSFDYVESPPRGYTAYPAKAVSTRDPHSTIARHRDPSRVKPAVQHQASTPRQTVETNLYYSILVIEWPL